MLYYSSAIGINSSADCYSVNVVPRSQRAASIRAAALSLARSSSAWNTAFNQLDASPDRHPSYDRRVDDLILPFVRHMGERFGTDPAFLVSPSGSIDANLLVVWHYPPMRFN